MEELLLICRNSSRDRDGDYVGQSGAAPKTATPAHKRKSAFVACWRLRASLSLFMIMFALPSEHRSRRHERRFHSTCVTSPRGLIDNYSNGRPVDVALCDADVLHAMGGLWLREEIEEILRSSGAARP